LVRSVSLGDLGSKSGRALDSDIDWGSAEINALCKGRFIEPEPICRYSIARREIFSGVRPPDQG